MSSDTKNTLFQVALRYLGYRDRFKKEIELRLKEEIKKKFPKESLDLIPSILKKLERSGLINDQELINIYIKNQHNNNLRGPYAIKQKLQKMGAPRDLTTSSINKLISNTTQTKVIEKLIIKRKPDLQDTKIRIKFQNFLIYRGFSQNLVREKIAFILKKE